jgi:predicted phage-related endonuclease
VNAPSNFRGVQVHCDFEQGSSKWLEARCGMLTASEFDRILTPTLKIADNPKSRAHLWEMAAQRISGYVEPQYISDAMLRGQEDEILARDEYSKHYAPVQQCGFVTNSTWGFTIGCSPDGLVGDDGLIEIKSRCQKYQVETICSNAMPDDFMLQVQGELLVTQRQWCDFISYCSGLPMIVVRVFADKEVQSAIVDAAAKFESRINEVVAEYGSTLASGARLTPTERRIEEEMVI